MGGPPGPPMPGSASVSVVYDAGDAADENIEDFWVVEASAARKSFIRDIQSSSTTSILTIVIISSCWKSQLRTRES